MKYLCLLTLLFLLNAALYAQSTNAAINKDEIFALVESAPEYPGGMNNFYKYITKNLKYPEVAELIGLKGTVIISFIVDLDGRVIEATPRTRIGAGLEAEAITLIGNSPKWKPGVQNSKLVRVQYNVPINFKTKKEKVTMKELKSSDYGFLFFINGQTYTIEKAETIIGKWFLSNKIETAKTYSGDVKYPMPDKKAVYLLKMKA